MEAMESKKVNEVQAIPKFSEKCCICENHGHSTNECPTIPAFKEVLLDQSNTVNMTHKPYSSPYSNSYNPGWRSHPNFSWRGDQHVAPATLALGPSQLTIQALLMQKKGVEDTVQQLSVTHQQFMQEKGKFPARSQPNPQGQPHQVPAISEDPNLKSVKAVTTLRSGKVVDIPAYKPYNSGKVFNPSNKDGEHVSDEHEKIYYPNTCSFSSTISSVLHKDKHLAEILDVFRQVSAIIQSNTPPKYKDPGAPTIACVIGNSKIGHALLDLGSSVNLLPYTVQPQDLEEVQEVNLLENILDEDFHLNLSSTDLQLSLESILSDVNILDDTSNVSFVGTSHGVL
ncbi:uncharacterized protein LOC122278551 [Carya illinoinensis]|uniref:uncharacterized protein LOC122278551 n=1 Tax=Carya illinoinensis TaxID=32201 RepID=UPI001C71EAA3|nr:uncharacterized protein LOC122278551 [Carya illinoinensis]